MGWHIFYSYSHKDGELLKQLVTFLGPLRQQKRITEWNDRELPPGASWDNEIRSKLSSADLVLFLISPEFLDSDYCFGVEVQTALDRMKRGETRVVPILLRPCLWEESRFSELQIIPRDGKAVSSWHLVDEALRDVAKEISKIVAQDPPQPRLDADELADTQKFDSSLELVRNQVRSYAHIYERTRQRMPPSNERTGRMEQIVNSMRSLATASYPLLDELVASPSPGERLAAIAILQVFASERFLSFLVDRVKSEMPFVCYHAIKALHFAVSSLDPASYDILAKSVSEAKAALHQGNVGDLTDRASLLAAAEHELESNRAAMSPGARVYE